MTSDQFRSNGRGIIYTPTLFWGHQIDQKAKLLETLIYKKWPPRINPGGHHFVVLNISINNTPVFVLYVVTFKKQLFRDRTGGHKFKFC
jgi:hypothetical protein